MTKRKFVVADPGLCIGCKTCMAACLCKHDTVEDNAIPRLNLVTTLRVSVPVVCHHCIDAPCVASCPTGALYADELCVGVRNDRCIGCRNCILACPYGAIDVVTHTSTEFFGDLLIGGNQKSMVVKCDLCTDSPKGPACIDACPTKGLMLVDQEFLEAESERKRMEAARTTGSFSSVTLNSALS